MYQSFEHRLGFVQKQQIENCLDKAENSSDKANDRGNLDADQSDDMRNQKQGVDHNKQLQ